MSERLQKVLAARGFASRRGAEKLITDGLVKVNGELVTQLGSKVEETDIIEVDEGGLKKRSAALLWLALHKPVNVVTTRSGSEGKSVMDLISKHPQAKLMNPVGRLDKDSSGLLLLTNDGVLGYAVVNPQTHLEKEYEVSLVTPSLPGQLKRMADGVPLDGSRTRPAVIEMVNNTRFVMTITEGRNRQIRRMAEKVGLEVGKLKRLRIGPIELGSLAEGAWRELSQKEVSTLRSSVQP
jgi:23S rRNA pseudouridine2605 synthase